MLLKGQPTNYEREDWRKRYRMPVTNQTLMDIDRKTQREPDRGDLWQGTRIIQHNDVVQNSIVN